VTFRGTRVHVRGYLERFLFRPEQADMPVRQLSGGEQSRLLLAKLMLREAQVLVLDEPTNDLDLATLAVLEESLTGFDGAVLLVTHDRYFLDQVATTILAFGPAGQIVPFATVEQWEAWRAERAAAERPRGSSSTAAKPSAPRRKLSYKEQREYDGIEAAIAAAEATLAQAQAEAEDPAHASNAARLVELFAAVAARQSEVDRLYARWSELEAKLTGSESAPG
jgi:ABC transport system ATP-binding/permease protein